MNERERFINCMHYRSIDRIPYWDFGFWNETIERWYKEGLPREIPYDETMWFRLRGEEKDEIEEYFGMDRQWRFGGPDVRLIPRFEEKVIEEDELTQTMRGEDGVVCQVSRKGDSVPHFVDWTLKNRKGWEEYRKRLDPKEPARYEERKKMFSQWKERDYPLGIFLGSLFGWIRNWMGLENVSLLLYDDPQLFAEMVEYLTDFICQTIEPFLKEVEYDYVEFWEDMAFANGPMMSPVHFEKFLVPQYRKITSLLNRYGVDVVMVDCDGVIDKLIPLWLDCGVNCMFPLEIGAWKADPMKLRKEFGKDLLIVGGIDKRMLAKGKKEIDEELARRAPLIEDGGYIPLVDHRVPPDVSLENYKYYLKRLKEMF